MGSNHMEGNEQAVLFQKEGKGKVYVSGRSGSGKTTLLLKRLHFLKEEGISFQHVLNLAAYKEDTRHLEHLWTASYDPLEEEKGPTFKTIYQFCYQVLHR